MPNIVDSSYLLPPVSNAELIAHPSSGIFIQYVGEYVPSDFITNISIIIPLTATYCNVVPLIMAQNIPECAYLFNSTGHNRFTRQIGEGWIALGVAGSASALAISNRVTISSLETKFDNLAVQVAQSQHTVNVNTVRIGHLHSGVMKIGSELRHTQESLFQVEEENRKVNRSIFAINSSIGILGTHINNLEHKMRNVFLTQAINDIYKGHSTLSMVDPGDMPLLISQIFNDIDEKSRKLFHHMPITQILNNLLIGQHLTFVLPTAYQTNNTNEIGRLIFTNFFGIPRPNSSYSIYEVKSVPYFIHDSFIRVIELPAFIGQCIEDETFLEFYAEDTKSCVFSNWTACKDQPPILKSLVNPCLDEILTRNSTSMCIITKLPTANFFIHQLTENYWLVSFNESRDCIKMPLQLDTNITSRSKLIIKNIRITLPPVALVSVLPMTTIICEGFSLVGQPLTKRNKNIIIVSNGTMHRADIDVFNIQIKLHENWNSKQFNSNSIDGVLNFIKETPSSPPPPSTLHFLLTTSIWETIAVVLIVTLSIITVIAFFFSSKRTNLCCCFRDKKKDKTNVEINLQQYDRPSADQLKKYYELAKQQKYYERTRQQKY